MGVRKAREQRRMNYDSASGDFLVSVLFGQKKDRDVSLATACVPRRAWFNL